MAENLIIHYADGRTEDVNNMSSVRYAVSASQQIDGQNSDVVNLQVRGASAFDIPIGSWINVIGVRYWLNMQGTIRKNSEHDFTCDFKFEGPQYQLARSIYDPNLDPTHSGATLRIDSLTADLKRFMEVLIMSSQEATPNLFTLGTIPDSIETKTLTFADSDSCLSVLQKLCSEYDTFFTFTPNTDGSSYAINMGKEGSVFPYTFQYGIGKGIYELERTNVDSSNIVNRLKAFGSTKNILASKYGDSRLHLPDTDHDHSYVEDTDSQKKFGIWVGKKNFDDIYPHRTGTITALGDDVYTFIDANTPFDLMAKDSSGNSLYLPNGESAKIHFNSGQLAGMEFDIISYDDTKKSFVVKAVDDESGFRIPSKTTTAYQMAVGDTYVLLNIILPNSYVTTAEKELKTAAEKELKQRSVPSVKYTLKLSEFFLKSVMQQGADQNIFWIGDLIHIKDADLNIDANIKITGFIRNLIDPYDYEIKIADQMTTVTVTSSVLNDIKTIDNTLIVNNLYDAARARRNWRDQQQLLAMIFDPDGYFTDKIRPMSVETSMLSVGAKSMQFGLVGTVFQPNYGGDPNVFHVDPGGSLVHYTIDDNKARTWQMANLTLQLSEHQDGKSTDESAFYIYAYCLKDGTTGQWVVTTKQHNVNDTKGYYFWVGVLNAVEEESETRSIALTYGFTTINGRYIRTGRIQSADGVTYFDLDAGEIGGKIIFTRNNQRMTVDDLAAESEKTKDYIDNTLPGLLDNMKNQIEGQIEQWFYEVDPTATDATLYEYGEPEKDWETNKTQDEHLGDLYYNTKTGKVWRYIKGVDKQPDKDVTVYYWQPLSDEDTQKALSTASDALALAKTKRRIFTSQPYPPYDVGDLWVQGDSGDIMRCNNARATGSYTASDWGKASKYTDDSSLKKFIMGTYANMVLKFSNKIDGKIESWFQNSDPADNWTTDSDKWSHQGDMWFDTSDGTLHRYKVTKDDSGNVTGSWELIRDQKAIDAYDAASKAQDTADGKRRIFIEQPYPPYDPGDLWTDGTNLRRCITGRQTGSYVQSDWGMATNYDNTQTVIDGGIVTAGTVQLAGDSGSILAGVTGEGTTADSVRFWAGATKENRTVAPFRVLQDGSCYATKLYISGDSTFEGKMKAVSGSFKNLRCVNNAGEEVGGISFGSDGKMWFEGDLCNQGYDYKLGRRYRFYSSGIYCRGLFGARERCTVVVHEGYADYYVNGLSETKFVRVSLELKHTVSGSGYLVVPCYGNTDDAPGFPVDTIVFKHTSSYNYVLSMASSQRVVCINTDDRVDQYIWIKGNAMKLEGGASCIIQALPYSYFKKYGSQSFNDGDLGRNLQLVNYMNTNW